MPFRKKVYICLFWARHYGYKHVGVIRLGCHTLLLNVIISKEDSYYPPWVKYGICYTCRFLNWQKDHTLPAWLWCRYVHPYVNFIIITHLLMWVVEIFWNIKFTGWTLLWAFEHCREIIFFITLENKVCHLWWLVWTLQIGCFAHQLEHDANRSAPHKFRMVFIVIHLLLCWRNINTIQLHDYVHA